MPEPSAGDYAITGRSSEIEQAKRFDKENADVCSKLRPWMFQSEDTC